MAYELGGFWDSSSLGHIYHLEQLHIGKQNFAQKAYHNINGHILLTSVSLWKYKKIKEPGRSNVTQHYILCF